MSTDAYLAAVEAIADLRPCPFTGHVTTCQIKVALGEFCDLWPAYLFDDVAGDEPRGSKTAPPRDAARPTIAEALRAAGVTPRSAPASDDEIDYDDLEETLAELDRP